MNARMKLTKLVLLRVVLVARCLVSLALVWFFASAKPSTPPEIMTGFAPYTFTDGVLALILAGLALSAGWREDLAAVVAFGGSIRVAAALAIWYGPGIPYFPVTFVLYVGILAALGFVLGVLELGEAGRLRADVGWRPWNIVLAVEGCATVLLAILAFFTIPEPIAVSRLLVAGAVLEAFAVLAVGVKSVAPSAATVRARAG